MSCPVCGKEHHALCHKCPHDPEVQTGGFSGQVFESTPCSGCRPVEDDRLRHVCGRETVSFDEAEGFLGGLDLAEDQVPRFLDALQQTLRNILGIGGLGGGAITREAILRRMCNESLAEISVHVSTMFRKKVSIQAIHARLKKAERNNNLIRALLLAFHNRRQK